VKSLAPACKPDTFFLAPWVCFIQHRGSFSVPALLVRFRE
jgi:hypothetical protein